MDRIDYINELIEKGEFKTTRKDSIIINNLYSIITIVIISIAIVIYSNFLSPKDTKPQLTQNKQDSYIDERRKQIELSHKLNGY